jgi:heme-degrading monooxygenase HmoA
MIAVIFEVWPRPEHRQEVKAWRNIPDHRRTQAKGRAKIFSDYWLRIAGVIRDYGMNERAEAPKDSRAVHEAH